MFSYIILSSILALVGGIFYFAILKRFLQVLHAKYALMSIIALSLVIPFTVPNLPTFADSVESQHLFDYHAYDKWNVVDIQDPKLLDCYNQAATSGDVCNCEMVQKTEILAYKSHGGYNIIYWSRQPVIYTFLLILGLMILDLGVKLMFLVYLAMSSRKEKYRLADTNFYILYTSNHQKLPISSFTLFRHYIICPPLFEKFTAEEQKAILLHEIAHLQQHDTWQQIGLNIARLFWWMMPMYYFFKKELRSLNEFVADEFAVEKMGNTKKYATILLKAKECQLNLQQASYTLTFAKAKSLFKDRILRLVHRPKHTEGIAPKKSKHLLFALCTAVGLLWATSVLTAPVLQDQVIAFKQYEVLKMESDQTGKSTFCKDCLIQKLTKRK
ncbi:MAG: hypothetical protein GY810_13745 [Aureispira sp.]|nr:hypothetical protein [Aureispira sp.]